MDMPTEELTDEEIENLFARGVVKANTKRFLWHVGYCGGNSFLTALLLGLSRVPEADSTRRGDFAEAKIRDDQLLRYPSVEKTPVKGFLCDNLLSSEVCPFCCRRDILETRQIDRVRETC